MSVLASTELAQPRYTLSQTDPKLIERIIQLRNSGLTMAQVAHELNTSRETIRTVEITFPQSFQAQKKLLAKRYTQAASQSLEQYQEALDAGSVNVNMLPLHSCQLMDKSLALLGEAQSIHRVEVVKPDLDQLLDSMPVIELSRSVSKAGEREEITQAGTQSMPVTDTDTGSNTDQAK